MDPLTSLPWDAAALSGVVGAALCCGAYLGLHWHRISLKSYAAFNLASAIFCGLSLYYEFNLGSALIEAFFAATSIGVLIGLCPEHPDKEPSP